MSAHSSLNLFQMVLETWEVVEDSFDPSGYFLSVDTTFLDELIGDDWISE